MKQRVPRSQPVHKPQASTWLPPEQRDTAWWIFHKLFLCRLQRIQTLTIEEMREFGTPTSGDSEYDKQMQNERVDRMLSIAQMMQYWSEGITIGVSDEKDTKLIYELITNHLSAWRNKLEFELNVRNAPIEDLVNLDKFANAVYRHAKYQFSEEYVDSILHRKLAGATRVPRGKFLKAPNSGITTINKDQSPTADEQNERPERVGMADAFTRGRLQGPASIRWK
jgi:hypothetical protein